MKLTTFSCKIESTKFKHQPLLPIPGKPRWSTNMKIYSLKLVSILLILNDIKNYIHMK